VVTHRLTLSPEEYGEHNDRMHASLQGMWREILAHYEQHCRDGDMEKAREKKAVLIEVFENCDNDANRLAKDDYARRFAEQSTLGG
jgi:hypothetical protein